MTDKRFDGDMPLAQRYSQGRIGFKILMLITDRGRIKSDEESGTLYREYSKGRVLGENGMDGICMRYNCHHIERGAYDRGTIGARCPACNMRTVASYDQVFHAYDLDEPEPCEPQPYVPPTEAEMRQMIVDKKEIDDRNWRATETARRDSENAKRIMRELYGDPA